MPTFHPTHVRCRLCGLLLDGWLPWARAPHTTLLMGHLGTRHPVEFSPLLTRMATEDLGTVAMEACARVVGA
jgi:hypothetical protein